MSGHARLVMAVLLALAVAFTTVACEDDPPNGPTPLPCSYAVTPASLAFEAGGGSQQVSVTTTSACTWTASSGAAWLTVAAGASGTGNGTVQVDAAAHAGSDARAGTLTIAGVSVGATQAGVPPPECSYRLVPTGVFVRAGEGAWTFRIETAAACAWTATSQAPWLVITDGGSGTGTGTVHYFVERHREIASRSATILVADQIFTVTQEGDVGACEYSVMPVEFTPCVERAEMTATVSTTSLCPWTVDSGASWLAVDGGVERAGPGTVKFVASENYAAPRVGQILLRWPAATAGQNLQIAQAGCSYSVSVSDLAFGVGGGNGTFNVVQATIPIVCGGPLQDACRWSAVPDAPWITIVGSPLHKGDDPVSFTVAPNGTGSTRVGHIVVRDKVVTITQAGS